MIGVIIMIKIIAFDFVGVLVGEKDIELGEEESKLERMFGPNFCDSDYIIEARKFINNDRVILSMTEGLISKLYVVKDKDIFKKIKERHPEVKNIIATNHVSLVRKFIDESFDINDLDDLVISAEIHHIKPNEDFYQYILNKYNIKPEELLFIDDNEMNINGAKQLGINTILIDKKMKIVDEVDKYFKL